MNYSKRPAVPIPSDGTNINKQTLLYSASRQVKQQANIVFTITSALCQH